VKSEEGKVTSGKGKGKVNAWFMCGSCIRHVRIFGLMSKGFHFICDTEDIGLIPVIDGYILLIYWSYTGHILVIYWSSASMLYISNL
jgi:hypothetical protein